jgi:hypothetical protein
MAKWYLYPDAEEFSSWSPRKINKHVKPSAVIATEPQAALTLTAVDKVLLPLTDAGPSPAAGQQVASRTITVDLEAGTATAEYTYEAKVASASERNSISTANANAMYRRKAAALKAAGKPTEALELLISKGLI